MKTESRYNIREILIICFFICILVFSVFPSYSTEKEEIEIDIGKLALPEAAIKTLPLSAPREQTNFTLVLLPDSQIYSQSYPHIYTNQTEWIVNNSARLNIEYVLHEGDITNRNTVVQWENANTSQHVLDGNVPYTVSPGNHDLGQNGNAANRDTYMNDYFNLTQYEATPTFGGAFEPNKIENTYHLFSAVGIDWMIVSLEFAPRDAVLVWANQVVADHPDRIVFVVTHNYLAGNARNHGYGGPYQLINDPAGAASGEDIWQNFAKKHRNIMCVFCGHILVEAGYLKSNGDFGNPVHQMLANFQMLSEGGGGYMRLVKFDIALKKIFIETYSPYYNQYKNNSIHKFELGFKKWDYINEPPFIQQNITSIELTEDAEPIYIGLDSNKDPNNGIFNDSDITEGDELTYYIWNKYTWVGSDRGTFDNHSFSASIEDNDTIKIEPKDDKYGSDKIKIKAVDERDEYITHEISITIAPVNDPPIINKTKNWQYQAPEPVVTTDMIICKENQWVNFTVTVYDPNEPEDNAKFRYSCNNTEASALFFSLDETTGYVTFLPGNSDVGKYYLKITVNDTGEVNNIGEYEFTLEIENINDPPMIVTTDVLECVEDNLYSVDYEAIDLDPTNDILVWDLDTNASFLSLDRNTGNLSGTPTNDDVGHYYVNITVSDKNDGFDNRYFILSVLNENDQPTLKNAIPDLSFFEDTIDANLNLNDWFIDIDGDPLIFSTDDVENITLSISRDGLVEIIPAANWSGEGTLNFNANDTISQVSTTVDFTVKPVNDAPMKPLIQLVDMVYYEKRNQPAIGIAKDVDIPFGDELDLVWESNSSGEFARGTEINLSLRAGVHTITLTAIDSKGERNSSSIELEILALPSQTDQIPEKSKDEPNSDPGMYYMLAGVVVIVIILLFVLFLIRIKKKKNELPRKHPEIKDGSLATDPHQTLPQVQSPTPQQVNPQVNQRIQGPQPQYPQPYPLQHQQLLQQQQQPQQHQLLQQLQKQDKK